METVINNNQRLMDQIKPDLPIRAYPIQQLVGHLHNQFPGEKFTTKSEVQIINLVNLGNEGGVGCEILPTGFESEDAEGVILCSITHLKIKRGEPHYADILKYQTKRARKLKRQNRRF